MDLTTSKYCTHIFAVWGLNYMLTNATIRERVPNIYLIRKVANNPKQESFKFKTMKMNYNCHLRHDPLGVVEIVDIYNTDIIPLRRINAPEKGFVT